MKYFFYTILLVATLGTVGWMVNPALVQQGAAFIGLELPLNSTDSDEKPSGEDQLEKFYEQYPFANNRSNATFASPNFAPPSTVPAVVMPEPASAPMSPFYVAPATPFPAPVVETAAPRYANSVAVEPAQSQWAPADWNNSNFDSAEATPLTPFAVYPPPVPAQEPMPVQQQSIYSPFNQSPPPPLVASAPPLVASAPPLVASAPSQDVFPAVDQTMPPGFAQTQIAQQSHQQPVQPQPIQQPVAPPPLPIQSIYPAHTPPPVTSSLQTQAVLIEDVPVHGTELVAKVGTQIILMGDLLPKIRRTVQRVIAENLKKIPDEERAKVPREEIEQVSNAIAAELYPSVLQEQIIFTLVYSDYLSQQPREQRAMFDERLTDEFNRKEIPEMMKEFNVENEAALKRYLEQYLGSSLEKERKLWVQEQIVRQWIMMSIQRATPDATQDEMMEFYEKNLASFTTVARARWQEMVVLFSRHSTEEEAWNKMRWMGNQVASGAAPFESIAQGNSDGFTAAEGGIHDWTTKGSLASTELEQAIFSQPIGQLSPAIIRSERGLHIIRVVERQEANVKPFTEAQVAIRDRMKNTRTQQNQDEYLAELHRRFPTFVVRDRIDFDINVRTARSAR
ncbi:MAG: peptidyl-prolyl cis-trans isomerase [Planctomycetaceae bacterium]|nr:peptidyl-prolyl cis-trans isomerase [Planctomycetaceae bacterium]